MSPEESVFWKVVSVKGSSMHSAIAEKWSIEYKRGESIRPPIGKIFAFDNESDARQWGCRNMDLDFLVITVVGIVSPTQVPVGLFPGRKKNPGASTKDLELFWKMVDKGAFTVDDNGGLRYFGTKILSHTPKEYDNVIVSVENELITLDLQGLPEGTVWLDEVRIIDK